MKIGIDARMYGLEHAGIGRYVQNLVLQLLATDQKNDYVLFVRKNSLDNIKKQVSSIKNHREPKFVVAEARHYSVKEQLLLPFLLAKEKLDLVHFPHFNVPVFSAQKFVVTIHDLLWHEMTGSDVTTLSGVSYYLKYQGYKYVFSHAVKKSKKIFVPSRWVKKKLLETYSLNPDKIIVTYEGVEESYAEVISQPDQLRVLKKYRTPPEYLIYTGSAYPHKNLDVVLKTIGQLKNSSISQKLFIASARNVFTDKLKEKIKNYGLEKEVTLLGFVPDTDLKILYQHALAFVFPSFSEGFGLPGLEAMACGLPVLAAKNGVFAEIYQKTALFFDPASEKELILAIKQIKNPKIRQRLSKQGLDLVRKYSFAKMAKLTLEQYMKVK